MHLLWQSLQEQKLDALVPIHFLNAAGGIATQADHPQSFSKATVQAGLIWHDTVRVPFSTLAEARTIAIGVHREGGLLPFQPEVGDAGNGLVHLELKQLTAVDGPPSTAASTDSAR